MKTGDQVKLKKDINRGAEFFKKGDKLILKTVVMRGNGLRSPTNKNGSCLWAVKGTNIGFWEDELELFCGASSLIYRDANGDEKLIVCKGDRVIIKTGELQGLIGVVDDWDEKGKLTIRAETNGIPFYAPYKNVRMWTEKDDTIKFKFKKLFAIMGTNRAVLNIRKKDNFIKKLLDNHAENLKHVKYKYDRFLYHEEFTKKDIQGLNKIWKIENESMTFYNDPKWVYDKSLPHGYKSKYTEMDYKNLLSFQSNAHAAWYGPTA